MMKKRKKEKGEADLRWLLSLVALLVAVVPGGIVEVFLLLPCAKAQASIFPPPRLLFFVLICFSSYALVSVSFYYLVSLSSLSLFFFSFSLFCSVSPLFVSVPLFFSFPSFLFYSDHAPQFSKQLPLYFSFICKPPLFPSGSFFFFFSSSLLSICLLSLFFPSIFSSFFLPYFFNSLLSLCFCSLFIQNPLSSCSVLFSLYFPPILSFFPTPLTLSLPWYL